MNYEVLSNENNANITLDGTECNVIFNKSYRSFAIMNNSSSDVIASIYPNKTSSDDGVRVIPSKQSRVLNTAGIDTNTLYLNGTGSVEVSALNGNAKNPFLNGGSGTEVHVPTTLAELSDDSTHRLVTDTEKATWNNMLPSTAKGASNGVAELDSNGKVPSSQLPSYVDDVVEGYYKTDNDRFYEESTFTTLIDPVAGKSWVDIPTNKSYRWTGSVYTRVDEGVQIGETADTAYAGNKGKANADAIAAIKDGISIDSFSDVETALSDKISKSQTAGLVKNDGTIDTTTYVSDISGKADKVSGATNGNFAGLDANGNLLDSGKKASDFTQVQSDWRQYLSSEKDFIKNKPALSVGHGRGGNIEGGTGGTTYNYATWSNSVAYGYGANATADYALAYGQFVSASHNHEVAFGKYNASNADTAFSFGNGAPNGDNHNLMELKTDGTLFLNDNAVQTKNLATPLSISGTSQSTVESALGAISKKTSLMADINRNLGTEITAAQKLAIATGTFEDLPIGAYWTLNNTIYRIAHHDYYLGTGDTACTSHHIVIVPDNSMYNAVMNDTNTTTGGYANSKMRTTNLATALSTFETDFGVTHILNHRILITNAVSDGQASGWVWPDSKVDLMSENMVFGHPVLGQSGYETGIERGQLALFSLYPEFIQKQRIWYWLRSVSSGSDFCHVAGPGYAGHYHASGSNGVRPYACIYFDDVL